MQNREKSVKIKGGLRRLKRKDKNNKKTEEQVKNDGGRIEEDERK